MKTNAMVVIPAYNEEKTVGSIVKSAKKYCNVLVVNDCSTDKTAEIAKKNGASVLSNKKNLGYDGTLNRGIAEAAKKAEMIILMDADGQHNPGDIPKFIKAIENGADFAVGIRPYRIRLAEKLYAKFSSWKIGVLDPLCGFKAFRSKVYKKIGHYDSIGSIGTEMMFAVKKLGHKIAQVKIALNERKDVPRFAEGIRLHAEWKIFKAMVKVMVRYR